MKITKKYYIYGVVQGIGFRPFLRRFIENFELLGSICNSGGIVELVLTGEESNHNNFVNELISNLPVNAKIENIISEKSDYIEFKSLEIIKSQKILKSFPDILPDIAICEECRNEMLDKSNRRYLYPFISCTSCGPRFSIIKNLPYDRENTSMKKFKMCKNCLEEYSTIYDRRFHAQTISCKECEPVLYGKEYGKENVLENDDAIRIAVENLANGKIIAVKNIGGFHLVCDAKNEKSVISLRKLKGRERKPFALCFRDIKTIEQYCFVSEDEKRLLKSSKRPIALLKKKKDFSKAVEGESLYIGAMLPSSPLQVILLESNPILIMTSANLSSSPLIYKNEDMLNWQNDNDLINLVLYHERDILIPSDDSVTRILSDGLQIIRRARGFVPEKISIENKTEKVIFSAGADVKSTFGFLKNNSVVCSQYIGDLENFYNQKEYANSIEHFKKLYNLKSDIQICDMHPDYFSSKSVKEKSDIETFEVQHHHAHGLSVMAEYNLHKVIAVIFDGTGYGTDSTIWGGEFLICEENNLKRFASMQPIKMIGGDEYSKNSKFTSEVYLKNVGLTSDSESFKIISSAIDNDINCIKTTSVGRLFDAVSSLLEISDYNNYEGESAILLEKNAELATESEKINFDILKNDIYEIDLKKSFREIYEKKKSGIDKRNIALGFHYGLADAILKICILARDEYKINDIVISGGCFQNRILIEKTMQLLKDDNFNVFRNKKVPANDGGIALGQCYYGALNKEC